MISGVLISVHDNGLCRTGFWRSQDWANGPNAESRQLKPTDNLKLVAC
jgi:hypothetical protein